MKRIFMLWVVMMIVFGWTVSAHALLLSRLGGTAVYDTDLDLTWLADANAGAGSVFDDADSASGSGFSTTDGMMSWQNANDWAASLTVGGFTDWRLPTTLDPDTSCTLINSTGFNCTGSEMGHLFYDELGGIAGVSLFSSSDPDLALFTNIQGPGSTYWSGTQFPLNSAFVWKFSFGDGSQQSEFDFLPQIGEFAWAVRSGDVSAVPEPSTMLLLGSGLVGLIGFGRKKERVRG